jgi:GAF domain-containing protein
VTELNDEAIALGQAERLRDILRDICDATGMGFAAVARVTEQRWIACLVEDRIDFGIDPGSELKIRETICDEIRDSGEAVVIDDVSDDIKWSRHPVPVIYGFKSYCSFPVYLDDGTFFGTLCAIDPEPRQVSDEAIIQMFSNYARVVGEILSKALRQAKSEAAEPEPDPHAGHDMSNITGN